MTNVPYCSALLSEGQPRVRCTTEVVVLSDRPATVQHSVSLTREGSPSLDQLYTNEAIATLNELREQIRIARNGAEG